jgi:hypothetical protein
MHPFPSNLDLSPFVGTAVGHLSLLQSAVRIELWPESGIGPRESHLVRSVMTEGEWSLNLGEALIESSQAYRARAPSHLNSLLGRTVEAADVVGPEELAFHFQGGFLLKLYSEIGGYESVHLFALGEAHVY